MPGTNLSTINDGCDGCDSPALQAYRDFLRQGAAVVAIVLFSCCFLRLVLCKEWFMTEPLPKPSDRDALLCRQLPAPGQPRQAKGDYGSTTVLTLGSAGAGARGHASRAVGAVAQPSTPAAAERGGDMETTGADDVAPQHETEQFVAQDDPRKEAASRAAVPHQLVSPFENKCAATG